MVEVKDDATFVEALAMVDKQDIESGNSIFPIFKGYIQNYLQLIWDPESNTIFEDVALFPYGPDKEGNLRKFIPIQQNIEFNLYPDSVIELQPDAGCWWDKVKNRADIGTFKTILRKKYGKDSELFAHYFEKKE